MDRPDLVPPVASPTPTRRPARERPDPRPARLMMGAGALAAATVITAGLVDLPSAAAESLAGGRVPTARATRAPVERAVRYVRLKPGERAPRGAKVIREAAPTPRVVVRRIVAPQPTQARRTVVRTRQSGR